jgi:hypothetical protein
MLAFTSVYFFESGLFNGLQPIQIKKTGGAYSGAQRAIGPMVLTPLLHPHLMPDNPAGSRCREKTYSRNFGFTE